MRVFIKSMLRYACMAEPRECDPRESVEEFVASPLIRYINGNIAEGLESLMGIVEAEIKRSNPDRKIVVLGKEDMEENRIFTRGDLKKFVESMDWDGVGFIVFRNDICVVNWGEAFECLKGKGVDVYMGGFIGRGIPVCSKLVAPFDKL